MRAYEVTHAHTHTHLTFHVIFLQQHELFATVTSELSLKGFKEFLEREKAPAPLTEAEEDKLEIKKAEANPDIGKE